MLKELKAKSPDDLFVAVNAAIRDGWQVESLTTRWSYSRFWWTKWYVAQLRADVRILFKIGPVTDQEAPSVDPD